jgi:CCR4-NOT transcription complex subunit 1
MEEMKHLYNDAVRGNPRLLSVGTPEQAKSEIFSSDIEEEANSYFSRIYNGDLSIENVVKMLIQFKESPVKR